MLIKFVVGAWVILFAASSLFIVVVRILRDRKHKKLGAGGSAGSLAKAYLTHKADLPNSAY